MIHLASTSEDFREAFYWNLVWWGEAFNPITPFVDPGRAFTKKGFYQKAAAAGVVGGSMWLPYLFTGGGASHHIAREISRPTFFRSFALKADNYRAVVKAGGSAATTVARGAVRSIPAVSAVGAMAAGVHMFWNQVRSLDWIPNYYIGP